MDEMDVVLEEKSEKNLKIFLKISKPRLWSR